MFERPHRALLDRLGAANAIDFGRCSLDSAPFAAERMARPVGKRDQRSGVGSLRQRIRSQGGALAKMELRASRAS